ncbi:MAG: hypothetical protein LBC77_00855 [Spirochaetaceae bacterium]|jgi:hypothetical protein|nr:hypothetical protein [Spirochaetaceae bacterium]
MGFGEKFDGLKDELAGQKSRFNKFIKRVLSENKKEVRVALVCFFAIIVITVTATIIAGTAINNQTQKKTPVEFAVEKIPDTELFFPAEPDFLPEILLEQPRKKSWTEEDAASFWIDPLESDADVFVKKIDELTSAILERVP